MELPLPLGVHQYYVSHKLWVLDLGFKAISKSQQPLTSMNARK